MPAAVRAGLAAALLAVPMPGASAAVPGADGRIAWTSNRTGNRDVWSMNPDGSDQVNLTSAPSMDAFPAWSPDGTRIAFTTNRRNRNWDLDVMDADGSGVTPVTANSAAADWLPAWSPDGSRIAFTRHRDGDDADLWFVDPDGSHAEAFTAANSAFDDALPVWSPDGSRIAFRTNRTGNWEIDVVPADGSSPPIDVTDDPSDDRAPSWSPNGTRIAFKSNRTGSFEIYTMRPDGTGVARLTRNSADDEYPAWSPDGTHLAIQSARDGNQEIYTMRADGSEIRRLTVDPPEAPATDFDPDWQPVSPGPGADLSVSVVDAPGPAQVDDPLAFDLAVTDNGSESSSDATLEVDFPAGLSATSATPTQGGCSGADTVVCHLGSVARGSTVSVAVDAAAMVSGELTTTATVSGPEPDPSAGDDAASVTTLLVAETHEDSVTLGPDGFSPTPLEVPGLGDEVVFSVQEPGVHSVVDRSGLGLFSSDPLEAGADFRLVMLFAGGYPYRCSHHPLSEFGVVYVPMAVTPAEGTTTAEFTVRWALTGAPPRTWFDVQVRRPGGTFVSWSGHDHDTGPAAAFVPDGGPGTYQFRARLRTQTRRVYWSSPLSIAVS
ncbi:MAG: hypothetical protein ACJ77A_02250 [Actinomycetota bacterium]